MEIFQKVYRTLKPGGIFLFNIEHPVFTAGVGQDWIYTDDGKPQYWAIDNYFITGERNTHFLGCDVVDGQTVIYGTASEIKDTINYDIRLMPSIIIVMVWMCLQSIIIKD